MCKPNQCRIVGLDSAHQHLYNLHIYTQSNIIGSDITNMIVVYCDTIVETLQITKISIVMHAT